MGLHGHEIWCGTIHLKALWLSWLQWKGFLLLGGWAYLATLLSCSVSIQHLIQWTRLAPTPPPTFKAMLLATMIYNAVDDKA